MTMAGEIKNRCTCSLTNICNNVNHVSARFVVVLEVRCLETLLLPATLCHGNKSTALGCVDHPCLVPHGSVAVVYRHMIAGQTVQSGLSLVQAWDSSWPHILRFLLLKSAMINAGWPVSPW